MPASARRRGFYIVPRGSGEVRQRALTRHPPQQEPALTIDAPAFLLKRASTASSEFRKRELMSSPSSHLDNAPSGAAAPRRVHRGRANYPRKRAIVACEACRKRKIKCDNERPTCGGCKEVDIPCTFQHHKSDHSKYNHPYRQS